MPNSINLQLINNFQITTSRLNHHCTQSNSPLQTHNQICPCPLLSIHFLLLSYQTRAQLKTTATPLHSHAFSPPFTHKLPIVFSFQIGPAEIHNSQTCKSTTNHRNQSSAPRRRQAISDFIFSTAVLSDASPLPIWAFSPSSRN